MVSRFKSLMTRVNNASPHVCGTELEERRKAFVDKEADYATKIGLCGTLTAKKKKKQLYESRASTQFDRSYA